MLLLDRASEGLEGAHPHLQRLGKRLCACGHSLHRPQGQLCIVTGAAANDEGEGWNWDNRPGVARQLREMLDDVSAPGTRGASPTER